MSAIAAGANGAAALKKKKCLALIVSYKSKFLMASQLEKDLVATLQRYCGERGDNEGAVETLTRIIHERDSAQRMADDMVDELKVELFDMLAPHESTRGIQITGMDFSGIGVTRNTSKRTVTKAQIARRAGELVTVESEYYELKDRTLPVPKMQVIEDERRAGKGGIDARRLI